MKFINFALITLLACTALRADNFNDHEPVSKSSPVVDAWTSIGDLLLVRPIGAAVTVANFGIFAIASPFAAMADSTEEVYGTLVQAPGNYTFDRDLGDLTYNNK